MNATDRSDIATSEFQPLADFGGVTWAGANPIEEGFCLGSETGNIVLTDAAFQRRSDYLRSSASGEAINSLAYSQNWLAVVTRKDINFIGPFSPTSQSTELVTLLGGGRDVVVAPISGHFVIPLGADGVMFVKPGIGENDPVTISKSEKSDLNFYRVLALPGMQGTDVVVCAGRRGGLGYTDYREGIRGHMLHTVSFSNMDFVDVCSVATPEKPWAVVAAAKDGSLVFFDDIVNDKTPKTIKFRGIHGAVYRILSVQGNIYLLTSKGLFCLIQLAASFQNGETLHHFTTDILRMPIEAADANVVGKKWLLAVGADAVFRFDLEKLPKATEKGFIGEHNGASKCRYEANTPSLRTQAKQSAPNGREQPDEVKAQPRWAESSFEQKFENMTASV